MRKTRLSNVTKASADNPFPVPVSNAAFGLSDHLPSDRVQQVAFAFYVVVQRHRCHSEVLCEPPDAELVETVPIDKRESFAQDHGAGQCRSFVAWLWRRAWRFPTSASR